VVALVCTHAKHWSHRRSNALPSPAPSCVSRTFSSWTRRHLLSMLRAKRLCRQLSTISCPGACALSLSLPIAFRRCGMRIAFLLLAKGALWKPGRTPSCSRRTVSMRASLPASLCTCMRRPQPAPQRAAGVSESAFSCILCRCEQLCVQGSTSQSNCLESGGEKTRSSHRIQPLDIKLSGSLGSAVRALRAPEKSLGAVRCEAHRAG
jgi:hypothetical protein